MANQPRTRKRVHAIRRAPDGSAFEKWYTVAKCLLWHRSFFFSFFFLALKCNFCFYIFVFGYVAAIVVKLWCRLHWLTCTSVKQKLRTKWRDSKVFVKNQNLWNRTPTVTKLDRLFESLCKFLTFIVSLTRFPFYLIGYHLNMCHIVYFNWLSRYKCVKALAFLITMHLDLFCRAFSMLLEALLNIEKRNCLFIIVSGWMDRSAFGCFLQKYLTNVCWKSQMWFSRETFVETCGSRELIDIDQKGFEKWKNMSKEVTFRTENYVQILASCFMLVS